MLNLVPMEERHIPLLVKLEQACFSEPWTEEGLRAELSNASAVFFAAEEDGEIVGYAGMHVVCGEGYVDNVAVHPEHRRRGVGEALVEALLLAVKKRDGAFLTLEVRPSNREAVGLYTKLGFAPAGRRKGFYRHPEEDALLMTAFFNPPETA